MSFINSLNDLLWSYVITVVLVGAAVYFTIRSKGVQFRFIGDGIRIIMGRDKSPHRPLNGAKKRISSFKAFSVSLASRVGTGNLAGVASAMFVGGPGAAFITLSTAWALVDLSMGLVTLTNVCAIILLGGKAFALLSDYSAQRKEGIKDPVFNKYDFKAEEPSRLEGWE